MNTIVGYTGFVGSNLYASGAFDATYHSKNITDAYGTKPELLVYAGVRAEKYLANEFPEKDREAVLQAEENIRKIAPQKLVLISTIDVFKNSVGVDETTPIETEGLHAYGYNRYELEQRIRKNNSTALIVRLPGLFGRQIRKNFIYDMMNPVPSMLKEKKMAELAEQVPELLHFYRLQENGFYQLIETGKTSKSELEELFKKAGFSALNFTDSRSRYQFYPLERLWEDIKTALQNKITLLHTATEPVSAAELYHDLTGREFHNELPGTPADYDYRTVYAELFQGRNGYLCDKQTVLGAVRRFVGV